MKLSFHGAARTVTGSKHVLTLSDNRKVLLDCGLFQGGKELQQLNNHFGFNPMEIDALVLSHAHIDHSGLIPRLVKEGFSGPIYCSPATADLVEILLKDSAKIQEEDTKFINKRREATGKEFVKPLYTLKDVEQALPLLVTRKLHQQFEVIPGVHCLYTDAGHILGSCTVNLTIEDKGKTKKICFTGDIGRYNSPLLKNPEKFPQADIIICESTYGDSLHDDAALNEQVFYDIVQETCVKNKGKLIIPAFSVGRTQEIVYALNKLDLSGKLPPIRVFVDSPLSIAATEITKKHKECYNKHILGVMEGDEDPFGFKNLVYISERKDSQALNDFKGPCIIISASGMAEFGRIKHHIYHNIEQEKNTILIVGYCEPFSLGARLLNEDPKVKIFGEYMNKIAQIKKIKSFSAHGDYSDMLHYLSCQDPKQVDKFFLVHGEYLVQNNFKNKLIKVGFDFVEIPEIHQEFSI
ncbi:MAG: MBL fold metallo-hydrolase RNA specificity domain-containing protein [Chitinophagales bacterium]|jgi:metallo-beta-lactamase family protein|nr:MBL fold metallo-hydrolase [Sphingobacteriales bacterium]